MKHVISFIVSALAVIMSTSSCEININTGNGVSTDAFLTVYYPGGLPNASSNGRYDFNSSYLSDRDIEEIFYDLNSVLRPGFTDAVLQIDFYDRYDKFKYSRIYDFWWEYGNSPSGGWYAWEERR
ncbi:MAG: hypothetical protein K2O58_04210 [Bacteroidales bacterium]|nr:hypothetical protein [Bacteroidales bacterium]MDE7127083.1 hypothetical protein [Bacteroidales bacterium]